MEIKLLNYFFDFKTDFCSKPRMLIYTHWLSFESNITFPALVTCSPFHAFDSWGSSVPWQS